MGKSRWLWQVGPFLALFGLMAVLAWRQFGTRTPAGDHPPEELQSLLEQARTFQDNLKVALEPAFKPMVAAYVRQKYPTGRLEIGIRRITVRNDGRFPVVAEVSGAVRDLYVQEKFLFWWEGERWHMRYVEGDL